MPIDLSKDGYLAVIDGQELPDVNVALAPNSSVLESAVLSFFNVGTKRLDVKVLDFSTKKIAYRLSDLPDDPDPNWWKEDFIKL